MKEIRPLFWRRVLAWAFDSLVLAGLLAVLLIVQGNSALGAWLKPETLLKTELPALAEKMQVFKSVEPVLETLKGLSADDQAKLKKAMDQAFHDSFPDVKTALDKGEPPLNLDNLRLPERVSEALTKGLTAAARDGLSTDAAKRLADAPAKISSALANVPWNALVQDIFTLISHWLVWPVLLVIGWFFFEAVLGASPGKLLLGLRIGTADGRAAGLLAWVPRYLVKEMPAFLLLIGLLSLEIWWAAGALVFQIVILFSSFGLLGGRRQTLYDGITGTSVFDAETLKANKG